MTFLIIFLLINQPLDIKTHVCLMMVKVIVKQHKTTKYVLNRMEIALVTLLIKTNETFSSIFQQSMMFLLLWSLIQTLQILNWLLKIN